MALLRRLLVAVVVLAVMLIAADYGARWVTERRVAAQIQDLEKLQDTPEVSIGGVSFLTQAARGSFDDITVRTGQIPTPAGVPLTSVDAQLTGVSLPMGDLLAGRVRSLPVRAVHATALVSLSSLTSAVAKDLPPEVTKVALTRGPNGQLKVSASYSAFGLSADLAAQATLTLTGRSIVVHVPEANLGDVPEAFRPALAQVLTARVVLPVLPKGLTYRSVAVQPGAIAVAVTGTNVTLQ